MVYGLLSGLQRESVASSRTLGKGSRIHDTERLIWLAPGQVVEVEFALSPGSALN